MSKRETSARDFWAEVDLLRVAGKHPNIMTLRGVYEKEDTWYIVQELATGGELFDHLIHNGAYSEQQASETMRDLCGALQHLHNKGIIHGDVKPENILVTYRLNGLDNFVHQRFSSCIKDRCAWWISESRFDLESKSRRNLMKERLLIRPLKSCHRLRKRRK